MRKQNLRYTVIYKAGYRVLDNHSGLFLAGPYFYFHEAVETARLLNCADQ